MKKAIFVISLVCLMTTTTKAEYVTAQSGLRVRASPSLDAEVVDVLPFASEVSGAVKDGWMETEDGFLSAEYLSDEDPLKDWQSMGQWHLTAYYETGNATASGVYPEVSNTIAHNTLPFGTQVYIKGHGIWTVHDRGPASMGAQWCDLYLGNYETCVQFGSQYAEVWVKE